MRFFLSSILQTLLAPISKNEDEARREFILNVLLVSVFAVFACAFFINAVKEIIGIQNPVPSLYLLGVLVFFGGLWLLSRRAHARAAAFLFMAPIFSLAVFMTYRWGVDLPAGILLYVLSAVMAGVLIGARFALATTLAVCVLLITLGGLQAAGTVVPDRSWATSGWGIAEIGIASLIFLVIAAVSWLSNRDMERSLDRARRSEAELQKERDFLEVRVEERTRELRQAEMEKMTQAYRFVEFGRLAGGIFHDLMSPLMALSMNVRRIADAEEASTQLGEIAEDIERAKLATEHVGRLMEAMRRHLASETAAAQFSPADALTDLVRVLEPYARLRRVSLTLSPCAASTLFGDSAHFTQVMTNLVSNAIESYPPAAVGAGYRSVAVSMEPDHDGALAIAVSDEGQGISSEMSSRIFEPFFSTKNTEGLGIGLPLAKRIVEKEFSGSLSFTSAPGKGSRFVVRFPVREP